MRELTDIEWTTVSGGRASAEARSGFEINKTGAPASFVDLEHQRRFTYSAHRFHNTQDKTYKPKTLSYKTPYLNR